MAGPCSGLVVLDFSWGMAGGLATAVFADFGADVIKIEPPAGDPFRTHPAWLAWNRGKKSAVVDLKTSEGVFAVHRLAEQADISTGVFPPRRGSAPRDRLRDTSGDQSASRLCVDQRMGSAGSA